MKYKFLFPYNDDKFRAHDIGKLYQTLRELAHGFVEIDYINGGALTNAFSVQHKHPQGRGGQTCLHRVFYAER